MSKRSPDNVETGENTKKAREQQEEHESSSLSPPPWDEQASQLIESADETACQQIRARLESLLEQVTDRENTLEQDANAAGLAYDGPDAVECECGRTFDPNGDFGGECPMCGNDAVCIECAQNCDACDESGLCPNCVDKCASCGKVCCTNCLTECEKCARLSCDRCFVVNGAAAAARRSSSANAAQAEELCKNCRRDRYRELLERHYQR